MTLTRKELIEACKVIAPYLAGDSFGVWRPQDRHYLMDLISKFPEVRRLSFGVARRVVITSICEQAVQMVALDNK